MDFRSVYRNGFAFTTPAKQFGIIVSCDLIGGIYYLKIIGTVPLIPKTILMGKSNHRMYKIMTRLILLTALPAIKK